MEAWAAGLRSTSVEAWAAGSLLALALPLVLGSLPAEGTVTEVGSCSEQMVCTAAMSVRNMELHCRP